MAFKNWWFANDVIFKLHLTFLYSEIRSGFFKQIMKTVFVNNFLDEAFNFFQLFYITGRNKLPPFSCCLITPDNLFCGLESF